MIHILLIENRKKHRFVEIFDNKPDYIKFKKRLSPLQRILADRSYQLPKNKAEYLEQINEIMKYIHYAS